MPIFPKCTNIGAVFLTTAAMMAPKDNNLKISTNPSILPNVCDKNWLWFINSAATSHICENYDLSEKIHEVSPISIEMASGKSFKTNKRGTEGLWVNRPFYLQ